MTTQIDIAEGEAYVADVEYYEDDEETWAYAYLGTLACDGLLRIRRRPLPGRSGSGCIGRRRHGIPGESRMQFESRRDSRVPGERVTSNGPVSTKTSKKDQA